MLRGAAAAAGLRSRRLPSPGLRLRVRACTEGGPRRRAGRDPGEGPRQGARRPIVWACAPASAVLCVRGRSFVCSLALGSPAAAPIGRSSSESVCVVCAGARRRGAGRRELFPDPIFPDARVLGAALSSPRPSRVSRVHPRASVSSPWGGSYRHFLPLLLGLCFGRREMKQGRTWEFCLFPTGPESSTFICHLTTPTPQGAPDWRGALGEDP